MTRLYTASPKQWNHTGYVVPEVEHSESERPNAERRPADWLPVVRYDTKVEEYTVVAAGKVIAIDKEGNLVPAGLKLSFEAAGGSTILTYVAADVTEGTIDLTTGVSVTAPATYTQTQVTTALRARGLILAAEFARDFISEPIGYAPYSYWQWCGGDGFNPALYRNHNHNLQHQTAFACDKVLEIPLVPAEQTAETMGDGSISGSAITFGTTQWHSATGLNATTRYASLVSVGDNVVGYAFGRLPVAKITANTPITDSNSTLASKTEVTSIAAVAAGGSGYFYIDYEGGVLFLYESGGNAVPTGFVDGVTTIAYYQYETAATGTGNISQVIGDVQVGDFVTFDSNSNYVRWNPVISTASGAATGVAYSVDPDYGAGVDATISTQLENFVLGAIGRRIGQVVAVWDWPRSGIEKVMTQYQTLTAFEQMPGTATSGMTDAQVQSGAANQTAIINFITR
jgi:hypothetical protein